VTAIISLEQGILQSRSGFADIDHSRGTNTRWQTAGYKSINVR
jgi:hypothetical protein